MSATTHTAHIGQQYITVLSGIHARLNGDFKFITGGVDAKQIEALRKSLQRIQLCMSEAPRGQEDQRSL